MTIFTLLESISALSFIAMTAYLTGRSRFIMRCTRYPFHLPSQFPLIILFSFLAITGSYSALPWGEPLITTRLIALLLSGIAGGPVTGFSVGIICSAYMLFTEMLGTALAFYIVFIGTLSGLVRFQLGLHQLTPLTGASMALVAELCQITIYTLFSAEISLAAFIIKSAIPTMIVSVAGVWIFLFIVNWIEAEQDIYGARAAQLSLNIASRTLPYLRLGFNTHSATVTARIIYELTKVDAVSITGRYKRLAFIGQGAEHHKPGEPIISEAVKEAISNRVMKVINAPTDRGCPVLHCPLQAGVVVPLFTGNKVVGTIELARVNNETVSELDIRIANGIANLLSVQIQLAEIDEQRKMREKAELKLLRAQINPHFLFNTINIIMSFCRTDPDKARSLLGSLATLMHRAYSNQEDFLTLQDELTAVTAYLEIARSRFGDRLDVAVHVEDAAYNALVPALSLQPLVENALNHGLFPKLGNCLLAIEASIEANSLIITVTDNGVGIPLEIQTQIQAGDCDGIGLLNVHKRLTSLYGPDNGLTIASNPPFGTEIRLQMPAKYPVISKQKVSGAS